LLFNTFYNRNSDYVETGTVISNRWTSHSFLTFISNDLRPYLLNISLYSTRQHTRTQTKLRMGMKMPMAVVVIKI